MTDNDSQTVSVNRLDECFVHFVIDLSLNCRLLVFTVFSYAESSARFLSLPVSQGVQEFDFFHYILKASNFKEHRKGPL